MFKILRRNPRMAIGGVFFIIALIAIVIWLVTRKEDDVSSKPTVTFIGGEKIYNPANDSGTVSTYVEYSTGTSGTRTAAFIDIKVDWENGAGFTGNGVTALKLERVRRSTNPSTGSSATQTTTTDDVLNTKYDTNAITDFDQGTITFLGTELSTTSVDNVLGDNRIKVYYTTVKLGTNGPSGLSDTDWSWLGETTAISITQNDIDTTYDIDSPSSVSITLTSSSSSFSHSKTVGKTTYYKIVHKKSGTVIADDIRISVNNNVLTLKDKSNTVIKLTNGANDPNIYKVEKYMGDTLISATIGSSEKYLKYENNTVSFTDKNTIFTDQDTLDKSLFDIIEKSYTMVGDFGNDGKYYLNTQPASYDYLGNGNTTNIPIGPDGLDGCKAACTKNPSCHNFSWQTDSDNGDQRCYFKTKQLRDGENIVGFATGFVSYVKNGEPLILEGSYSKRSAPINAQYLRIGKPKYISTLDSRDMDLSEIYIYDQNGTTINKSGFKITHHKGVHQHYIKTFPFTNLLDDKYDSKNFSTTGTQLGEANPNFQWIELNLGELKSISKIRIAHRVDFGHRIEGMSVLFLDDKREIIEVTPQVESLPSNTKLLFHDYVIGSEKWVHLEPK